MKNIIYLLLLFWVCSRSYGQFATTCATSEPFCTGTTYQFPMNTNTQAENGPNYACLCTKPNPIWYYLLIDQSGPITIQIQSPTGNDIDFVCWGPFTDPHAPCQGQLTANCTGCASSGCPNNTSNPNFYPSGNVVDCSYDPAPYETVHISNAIHGQYYILCITNYSNQPGTVVFYQSNLNDPNHGTTNCNIVFCDMTNITYTVGACNPQTNTYSVTGSIVFNGAPTTGTLTITDQQSGVSQTFYPPFNSPITYTLSGINANGQQHTLHAQFSDAPTCEFTVTYTAPSPCNQCYVNGGPNISVCGLTAQLNATENPGDINTHWNPVPGITFSDINAPNPTITASSPGTYNLVWTITNSNGVTCSDTVTVQFKQKPTANFNVTSPICAGQNATATYTGSGGNQFVWNFSGGNPSSAYTQGPHTITYNTAGTYNVSLFVTSQNGCVSDTVIQQVVVNPLPPNTFTATSPICLGNPSIVTYSGGSGPYTYNWNFGGGIATPGTGPGPHNVTFNNTGTYAITLQVTNTQTGCVSGTYTQYVQVHDASTPNCCVNPNPNAGPDAQICGLTYTMQAQNPAPGNIATWSVVSGPGIATFSNIHSSHTNVTVSVAGTYVFQWLEVSGACDSADFVTVQFIQQPIANAGYKDQTCGLVYNLQAILSVQGSTGYWSVVPPNTATFSNPNSPSTTVTATSGYGIYYFVWTEQNGQCTSTDTVQITFLATPVVSAGADTIGCGQYAHLNAENTYPGYWTASTNVIYYPNSTAPNATVWLPSFPTGQSSYSVTFVWHAFNGICPGTDTVKVTFIRPPHTEAGPQQSVCGTITQLSADTLGSGIVSGYWTSSVPGILISYTGSDPIPWNPTVDASNIPNFFINSQREVYFYWHATNGPGCSAVDSVRVVFYEIPNAYAGHDTSVCGKSYTLQGESSIANSTGQWSSVLTNPGTANFIPPSSPNAFVSVSQYGTYTFIWTEMNAGNYLCATKDTVRIEFLTVPMPDAGLDFSVCDKFAYICATPGGGISGHWSGPSGVAFYDGPPPTGQYNPAYADSPCVWIRWPSENDTITMYWTEFNGVCYGYDSVNVYFGRVYEAVIL
ncbi:MAG: PKD domain-containing protein, partial [Bacteroidales bacterium]|nr:PKD domain-containing protein [Bacteroidales bacterium]